jgi:hypothetical protein
MKKRVLTQYGEQNQSLPYTRRTPFWWFFRGENVEVEYKISTLATSRAKKYTVRYVGSERNNINLMWNIIVDIYNGNLFNTNWYNLFCHNDIINSNDNWIIMHRNKDIVAIYNWYKCLWLHAPKIMINVILPPVTNINKFDFFSILEQW